MSRIHECLSTAVALFLLLGGCSEDAPARRDGGTVAREGGAGDGAVPGDGPAGDGGAVCSVVTLDDDETGPGEPSFSYDGDWSTSADAGKHGGSDHYASAAGASVVIRFSGSWIKLYGARAAWHGIAAVSLDDGAEADVDCYAAQREDRALLYESGELSPGPHRLTLRVTGRKHADATGTTVAVDSAELCSLAATPDGGVGDAAPPADGAPQVRPTMYVQGRQLYDRCGEPVVLRGVNSGIAFPSDPQAQQLAQVQQTGANAVRLTFRVQYNNSSPQDVDLALGEAFKQQMIPIPALWDATGDWSKLGFCTDFWTAPEMVAVLKKHEAYTLLNIANEAGDGTVSDAEFRQGYVSAVQKVRQAGLRMPIVIDAANWGRGEGYLLDNANYLLQQDPEHNLLFSWHPWDENQPESRYQQAFDGAIAKDFCFIVGEFSGVGVNYDQPIDYEAIMRIAEQKQIGWLWWWWTGGDGHALTSDGTFGNWANVGEEVCLTGSFSIKSTAKRTHYLQTGSCP